MAETPAWHTTGVSTPAGDFDVFTAGDGPPLCVTHDYSAFNETGDHFAAAFVPYRTVYLVNLRGAGRSPAGRAPDDLSMVTAVQDLEAIRESLGFPQWDFAGHSTGGMLGLLYAVIQASSLSALVVVGAAASREYNRRPDCIYHPQHPEFGQMQALIEGLKDPGLSESDRARLTRERTQLSLYRPELYDRYFDGRVHKHMAASRLDYFSRYDYPAFDLRDRLADVTVPTLIMGGRHDVQCPYWCSRELGELIRTAQVVEFAESNHYPFLEESQKFRHVVSEFLNGPFVNWARRDYDEFAR